MSYYCARWGPGFALVGADTRFTVNDYGPDGAKTVTREVDTGGKLVPMYRGWLVWGSHGEKIGAHTLVQHQVAALKGTVDASDGDAIRAAVREAWDSWRPDDLGEGDADRVRLYVAGGDGESFHTGRFFADGTTEGAWGRQLISSISPEMRDRDDAEDIYEELRALLDAGDTDDLNAAIDAAVASIHRAAELADDVSPEAHVGVVYRAKGGELRRHFERERS